jgi:hypothetical protein
MKALAITAFLTALVLPALAGADDHVGSVAADQPNSVSVHGGAEYGFVAGVGYGRLVRALGRPWLVGGDATLGWAEVDLHDYRLRASIAAPIASYGNWQLVGALAPTLRGTDNDAGRMVDVGVDFGITAGRYVPRWFAAGELGFDWAIATHVTNSPMYRDVIFADARDGWYSNAGGNLRYGLQAGLTLGRYTATLRAGQLRDVSGGQPLLPFYGTLAVDTRW